jgi:DNA-directed RNA polymerase specialized sigma24 family protein
MRQKNFFGCESFDFAESSMNGRCGLPEEPTASDPRAAFDRLLGDLRPRLHRYCARMTGSVVDGEDVVQEALAKAIEGFAAAPPTANVEGWLFRVAHNAALDHLRARDRRDRLLSDVDLETIADPTTPAEHRAVAAASLKTLAIICLLTGRFSHAKFLP